MIGAEQLRRDAYTDIGDAIRQLPAFGSSSSPNNTVAANFIVSGTPGIDVVNLRNLGVLRTLVLFNGQRVVASALSGGVDLSTMPTSLVQRVDVVTGGASAAWGSDAVAGVVNVILNQAFRRAGGEYRRRRYLERRSPLLEGRIVLWLGFRWRPRPSDRQRLLSQQSRYALCRSALLVQGHQAGQQSRLRAGQWSAATTFTPTMSGFPRRPRAA